MEKLGKYWLTNKHVDFEYKQYMLLAYLEKVKKFYAENKLYPVYEDLYYYLEDLMLLKDKFASIADGLPSKLKGIDAKTFELIYKKIVKDDSLIRELHKIIDFSLKKIELYVDEGKKMYEYVEENISICPIGVTPLNTNEGYMLLSVKKYILVYRYHITLYHKPGKTYRNINIEFIRTYKHSILNTYESVKGDLLQKYHAMPNPATFAIESDYTFPVKETFLPIARILLAKHVSMFTA